MQKYFKCPVLCKKGFHAEKGFKSHAKEVATRGRTPISTVPRATNCTTTSGISAKKCSRTFTRAPTKLETENREN